MFAVLCNYRDEELKFSQTERAVSGNYAAAGDFSLMLSLSLP
jgi:hypothetical protein